MAINTAWFHQQLEARGQSVRSLARFMDLDPSAVSRMLKGERKMSAEEQDRVAQFLGVSLEEIAVRRRNVPEGFGESKQSAYGVDGATHKVEKNVARMFAEDDVIFKDDKRWMALESGELLELPRAYGAMKGIMTIPDDLDLTAPADPNWGKVYEDD